MAAPLIRSNSQSKQTAAADGRHISFTDSDISLTAGGGRTEPGLQTTTGAQSSAERGRDGRHVCAALTLLLLRLESQRQQLCVHNALVQSAGGPEHWDQLVEKTVVTGSQNTF